MLPLIAKVVQLLYKFMYGLTYFYTVHHLGYIFFCLFAKTCLVSRQVLFRFLVVTNPLQVLTALSIRDSIGNHVANLFNGDFRSDADLLQLLSRGLETLAEDVNVAIRRAVARDVDVEVDYQLG